MVGAGSVDATLATSLSVAVRWMVREVRRERRWRLDTIFPISLLLQETDRDLNPG